MCVPALWNGVEGSLERSSITRLGAQPFTEDLAVQKIFYVSCWCRGSERAVEMVQLKLKVRELRKWRNWRERIVLRSFTILRLIAVPIGFSSDSLANYLSFQILWAYKEGRRTDRPEIVFFKKKRHWNNLEPCTNVSYVEEEEKGLYWKVPNWTPF